MDINELEQRPDDSPLSPRAKRALAISWVLVIVWTIVIFAMSAKSGLELDTGNDIVAVLKRWLAEMISSVTGQPADPSPIGHFFEYLVFGALLFNALRLTLKRKATLGNAAGFHVVQQNEQLGKAFLLTVGIAGAYAITDEIHQIFVPGRTCDLNDWLVDITAAAIAAAVFMLLVRLSQKH